MVDRSRRPVPTPSPRDPREAPAQLSEAFESLGERFGEAGDHAARSGTNGTWELGIVVPVSMGELPAGALGWKRSVRVAPGGAQKPPGSGEAGAVYALLVPGPGGAAPSKRPDPPRLRSASVGTSAYAAATRSDPRIWILAVASEPTQVVRLRRLGEAVRRELDAD
ncbi:MAG TPA: hypothetical protein VGV64_06900 [Thermoplasmata archaeon]|nr:hypothetical protein [Thermoplasmata archaeon]